MKSDRKVTARAKILALTGLIMCWSSHINADVGNLIWQENFDSLNPEAWNIDVGDGCDQGLCGWGNQELQWYAENNVSIQEIPGEPGNNALVLEARDESIGGKAFTSGKVQSENKIAVQYGMIEVRMQIPDVGVGLWPAAWMLGTSTANWPSKGEIDMMEMGQSAVARADAGFPDAPINNYTGSNLIFYTDAACSEGNPTCAASVAWQTDNAHVSATPLTNRFVTYRTYWTDSTIRFTVEDNGTEYDMFDAPFTISEESNEFQAPFYLLLNLAVGGNFTDALTNGQVTAPRPAKMLVDYIRVYQLDGQGQVFTGNVTPPETGTFGVFTDTTATTNKLEAGVSSDIYLWNQDSTSEGNLAPFEGDNVIAWNYTAPGQWFGGGIQTRQARDMSNFVDGTMSFRIKIPADISFKIGVADNFTNENWLTFPAFETTYGLVRNGEWAEATIPVADLAGELIALQSIKNHFNIASVGGSEPTSSFQFAIDDILWQGGGGPIPVDSDGDGVNDDIDACPGTPVGTVVDSVGCALVQDSDGDGVDDTSDLCPGTPAGVVVDNDGCAVLIADDLLIEAENYDNYFDTSAGNNGGAFRTDDVDIEVTTDIGGGYNIGWTAAGEWLEYNLTLGAGSYDVSTRVASDVGGASYSISVDGNLIGSDNVSNTGGWQTFETHNVNQVTLTEGLHTLRIDIGGGEFNLNWINLVSILEVDSDNDGVTDDIDQCADTPVGTVVDAVGCPVPLDSDSDGVTDDIDQCADTPVGTVVDAVGCPVALDSDSDGVNDDIDQCANTPVGTVVDAVGCPVPLDSDSDGVNDEFDQCANTPAGTPVDAVGCPVETSTTGLDQISDSSVTFYVNSNAWADVHYTVNAGGQQNFRMTNSGGQNTKTISGLSSGDVLVYWFTYLSDEGPVIDTALESYTMQNVVVGDEDGDGVNDDIDQCLGTPVGTAVDAVGCAIPVVGDEDGDGVNDDIDQCLGTAVGTIVDEVGCPIVASTTGLEQDSDSSVTFFVNTIAWADVHYIVNNDNQQNFRMTVSNGRNIQSLTGLSAGDAISYWFTYLSDEGPVIDTAMQIHTMGAVVVGDEDGDGVTDDIDQCSGTPAGTPVDANGCPVLVVGDEDGDGVNDDLDQCLGTPAGTMVDEFGCPVSVSVNEVSSANDILIGGIGSDKNGFTLYVFDNDLEVSDSSCNDDCATNWPPLLVTDGLASGVAGLSTITRNDGSSQATYNGRPLYFYASDIAAGDTNGQGLGNLWWTVEYGVSTGDIVPLYDESTVLEQAIAFDRGDALVTRFADRGRDRHAKEDHFQVYDHYLSLYWKHRTARFQFEDYVAKGGTTIDVTFISEWKLGAREFRAWYRGLGTVAEYHGNYQSDPDWPVTEEGPGTWDNNFNKISDQGIQYKYTTKIIEYKGLNWTASDPLTPLAIGQKMEIEVSQFLDGQPDGRANYYGTTYLYIVGQGMVPWKTVGDFADPSSEREDSYPIAEAGWLGGTTTLPYNYTNEPDNHFMQMATNLSHLNGQPFVLGRRLFHTDFETGLHDESIENGAFDEMTGKAGTHFVSASCSGCHERNGRAAPVAEGVALEKWVFKVGDADGNPDPNIGRVLQPNNVGIDNATAGEGSVSIASWTESNGLRSPNYQFERNTPATFSARIAPQLVGLGLLEAVSEATILALEDVDDANSDGISGKAQRAIDPVTGEIRLGRFGWKASTTSVKHQIAGALNTDMGVMTSVLPSPDCGSSQTTCDNTGVELTDEHLDNLVKYTALLGVRAQRDLDDLQVQQGQLLFSSIGCDGCHTETLQTSAFHPLAELRNQTIHPYTDLLVHDMGAGLADSLGEGQATGAEWRTTPLWGLGLSACVTGGVINLVGGQGNEVCDPVHSYLHDGRARSIDEAILWHGGESENAKNNYQSLSANDKNALLSFLNSL